MVTSPIRTSKAKPCGALDAKYVRASLMVRGETVASWAAAHGVSAPLIFRMMSGVRPGIRGRSKALREQLVWLEARGKQLMKLQGNYKPTAIGKEGIK